MLTNNKYPIYIISKGRHDTRLTSKSLEWMKIDYRIVIEPQEFKNYSSVIDKKKILVLPFSNLNQGSIPARNWVWRHSISEGHAKHWILDDNLHGFVRLNEGRRLPVKSKAIFSAIENFVDRYENIYMSGMNYRFFAGAWIKKPYFLNTRIYSCILLDNKCEFRWRGKYNEDTDLSLRILKAGFCTILFNTFLCNKIATLQMKGGNTEEVYGESDNRKKFAESLQKQHPDLVKVVWRYNRWHHEVNYDVFKKNKLIRKDGIEIKDGVNNFGMILKHIKQDDNFLQTIDTQNDLDSFEFIHDRKEMDEGEQLSLFDF